jgi:G3E family GTPase
VQGDERRHVLQGVHRLLELKPSMPWCDEAPASKLVFIGRQLDAAALRARLEACLAEAPVHEALQTA